MSHPIDIDAAKNVVGAVCVAHTHTAHHARSCRVGGMYAKLRWEWQSYPL